MQPVILTVKNVNPIILKIKIYNNYNLFVSFPLFIILLRRYMKKNEKNIIYSCFSVNIQILKCNLIAFCTTIHKLVMNIF